MAERDYAPLSIACVRGLCDKALEKRKVAGVEIEKMVKDFSDANNTSQIKRLIRVLGQDLMSSTNPNVKNGALMGLSSVAVGLGKGSTAYLPELTEPIAACMSEAESRVRYQAAEALFNVAKTARGALLPQLPPLWATLSRLATDAESQVRQAAEYLDRLLKDIVTESSSVDVSALVPLIRERLYARAALSRSFAAAWVVALDAAPGCALAPHLPHLLDPMLLMLDATSPEIRTMCNVQLNEFLKSIKKDPSNVDFEAMINILITHAQSAEDLIQLTAITWMKEFVELSGARLLPYASGMLLAALPCLAYHDDARRNIRETAATVNLLLTRLVAAEADAEADAEDDADTQRDADNVAEGDAPAAGAGAAAGAGVSVPGVVRALRVLAAHSHVHTRVAALDWMLLLYTSLPCRMRNWREVVFDVCVWSVRDPADEVVRRALAVLAEICSSAETLEASPYYYRFLRELLKMFSNDDSLLEDRGAFIIRQLCVLLSAEEVYTALAKIVSGEGAAAEGAAEAGAAEAGAAEAGATETGAADVGAAQAGTPVAGAGAEAARGGARLVRVLNALLLGAPELKGLRGRLRGGGALARVLYGAWLESPPALLALCLLTHNYEHCHRLVHTLGEMEVSVEFLTEIDKLVQLIESPVFAFLRLELAGRGAAAGRVRRALFALLMLLPQGDAFTALRRRLKAAPPLPPAAELASSEEGESSFSFDADLSLFHRMQARQQPPPAPRPPRGDTHS